MSARDSRLNTCGWSTPATAHRPSSAARRWNASRPSCTNTSADTRSANGRRQGSPCSASFSSIHCAASGAVPFPCAGWGCSSRTSSARVRPEGVADLAGRVVVGYGAFGEAVEDDGATGAVRILAATAGMQQVLVPDQHTAGSWPVDLGSEAVAGDQLLPAWHHHFTKGLPVVVPDFCTACVAQIQALQPVAAGVDHQFTRVGLDVLQCYPDTTHGTSREGRQVDGVLMCILLAAKQVGEGHHPPDALPCWCHVWCLDS